MDERILNNRRAALEDAVALVLEAGQLGLGLVALAAGALQLGSQRPQLRVGLSPPLALDIEGQECRQGQRAKGRREEVAQ